MLDRDGYVAYDLSGTVIEENTEAKKGNGLGLVGDDAGTLWPSRSSPTGRGGHIIGDAEAANYRSRQYAPGWAPSASVG